MKKEIVDLFSRLGVQVTWIVLEGGPRSGFHPEVDRFLLDIFSDRDVQFCPGPPVSLERGSGVVATRADGSRFTAEAAFVNIGHRPNLASLGLDAAGISTGPQIETDEFCRTSVPGIYAVGDALRFWAGNIATGEARVAALHAAGRDVLPFDYQSSIIPFGYNPQAAKVGIVESEDGSVESHCLPYDAGLIAHIEGMHQGFVRIAWNEEGRIVGGHAVGWNAADVLAPIATAIRLQGTVRDLSSMVLGHPYYTELAFRGLPYGRES